MGFVSRRVVISTVLVTVALFAVFSYEKRDRTDIPQTATNLPSLPVIVPESEVSELLFQAPLDRSASRVTKKPFGIRIDPATSPVQPERFRGFHTGTDFEIFPDEGEKNVPVRAICTGEIIVKRFVSGYGGVLVQHCQWEGRDVTVLYGHLRLSSITRAIGSTADIGSELGVLGSGYGSETDGERKHLHLGIRLGGTPDVRGYVSTKSELSGWIDPCLLVCEQDS